MATAASLPHPPPNRSDLAAATTGFLDTPTPPQRPAHLPRLLTALVDTFGPAHARVTAELLDG